MTRGVALGAQPRYHHLQHLFVIGAVRPVTVRAAVADGEMLPQERPALVRMALVASVVDGCFLQQRLRGEAAVRIVAIGARHLAFTLRHMRGTPIMRLPVFMTLEAGSRLGLEFHGVLQRHPLHHRMTVGAGYPARFMRAAVPIGAVTVLVAAQADGVVGFDLLRCLGIKSVDPAHAAPAAGLHMRGPRAMAVFALHLSLLDFADPAHEGLVERRRLAGMAPQANLRSDNNRVITIAAGDLLGSLGGRFWRRRARHVPRISFFGRRQFKRLGPNLLRKLGERRIKLIGGLGLT